MSTSAPPATIAELLAPYAGEEILAAGTFFGAAGGHSATVALFRLGQRMLGRGGLEARFASMGALNYLAVTPTRVVLWKGLGAPEVQLAAWPRASVSGVAKRKLWTATHRDAFTDQLDTEDTWYLRTTLQTPDGQVVIDLLELHEGRPILAALGIALPRQKRGSWFVQAPDEELFLPPQDDPPEEE